MRYNRIGRAGVQVSAVGLGNWNTFGVTVDEKAAFSILDAARDAGINFLDTADTYGAGAGETILGNYLSRGHRDAMVVATKMFFPISSDPNDRGLSRKHIRVAVHRALGRLRTDYIDLLQCHRPDEHTPLEETIRTMDDLSREGKILYWGVSRYGVEPITHCHEVAASLGAEPPIGNQFPYNLLERGIEQSTLAACRSLGVGIIAYSPLAQGVLTGKYLHGQCPGGSRAAHAAARTDMWQHTPANEVLVARLAAVAARHDIELAALALAWCLRHAGVSSVLTGAASAAQIVANARAADVQLSAELLAEVETALTPSPVISQLNPNHPVVVDTEYRRSIIPCRS